MATSAVLAVEMSGHEDPGTTIFIVVVRQSAAILELLASEDQTLLIGRNSFLVLDFSFHIFDRITRLDLEGDGFTRESFYKNLHLENLNKLKLLNYKLPPC